MNKTELLQFVADKITECRSAIDIANKAMKIAKPGQDVFFAGLEAGNINCLIDLESIELFAKGLPDAPEPKYAPPSQCNECGKFLCNT